LHSSFLINLLPEIMKNKKTSNIPPPKIRLPYQVNFIYKYLRFKGPEKLRLQFCFYSAVRSKNKNSRQPGVFSKEITPRNHENHARLQKVQIYYKLLNNAFRISPLPLSTLREREKLMGAYLNNICVQHNGEKCASRPKCG